MKIGPLELRRSRADTTPPAPAPGKAKGASGTINMGGFLVPDEYLRDLAWPASLPVYQQMLRSDGAVREAYMHTVAPVINATAEIEKASDEPQDLEIAEMVRRAYFDWSLTPFKQTLSLTMKYLAQGFQLFEITDQVVDAELVYAGPDGNDVTVPSRQFVTWRRWEHRRPETLYKWIAPEGELEEVVQIAYKDENFGEWHIPADSVALFVSEQEGDDFTGVSLLRAAYKAWFMKDLIEKIMVMSIERHGIGINTVYSPDDARNDQALVDRLETMLGDLRAGESNNLIFPGPKQMSHSAGGGGGQNGYFFEINSPTGGLPDFTAALEYLRGEIKGAVLARFSELGHGSTGARATSDTQAEVWYASLHATADYVASVHNEKIKQLVDRNYPGVERYPTLVFRDIETKNLTEFADANAKLTLSGAILPDKAYRDYVRKGIDAPEEDETTAAADPILHPPTLTEPLGDGGLSPEEQQRRQSQQAAAASQASQLAELADRLDQVARGVTDARRKDARTEIADTLRGLVDVVKAMPQPQVILNPHTETHQHDHQHDHEHQHEGLSAEEARVVFEEVLAAAKTPAAASTKIERDADGRLARVLEFDAAGALVRVRRVTAHNDDGTIKAVIDEPLEA